MIQLLGIVAATLGIAILEAPNLWKKGWKKELWAFSILLLLGSGLCIAHAMQIKLPNPQDWVTMIYSPITKMLFGGPK